MKKSFICYQIEYAFFRFVEFVSDGIVSFASGSEFKTLKIHGSAKFKQKQKDRNGNNTVVQTLEEVYVQFDSTDELNELLIDHLVLRVKTDQGLTHIIGTHEYPVKTKIVKDLSVTQLKFECERPDFNV